MAGLGALGIGGVALAFAAQKTLENVFGTAAIAGRPAVRGRRLRRDRAGHRHRRGDRVALDAAADASPGRVVTIPNGVIAAGRIENFSARDRIIYNPVLKLVYATSGAQLTAVIDGGQAAPASRTRRSFQGEHRVRFAAFGDSGAPRRGLVLDRDHGLPRVHRGRRGAELRARRDRGALRDGVRVPEPHRLRWTGATRRPRERRGDRRRRIAAPVPHDAGRRRALTRRWRATPAPRLRDPVLWLVVGGDDRGAALLRLALLRLPWRRRRRGRWRRRSGAPVGLAYRPGRMRDLLLPDVLVAPFVGLGRALGVHGTVPLVCCATVPFILVASVNVVLVFALALAVVGRPDGGPRRRRRSTPSTGCRWRTAAPRTRARFPPRSSSARRSRWRAAAGTCCAERSAGACSRSPSPSGTARGCTCSRCCWWPFGRGRTGESPLRRALGVVGGFATGAALAVGLYDLLTWGKPFSSLVAVFEFTVVEGASSSATALQPPPFYFTRVAVLAAADAAAGAGARGALAARAASPGRSWRSRWSSSRSSSSSSCATSRGRFRSWRSSAPQGSRSCGAGGALGLQRPFSS